MTSFEAAPSSPVEYFEACLRQSRSGLGRATVGVLGRTGAGKSTLVNAIFGQELAAAGTGGPVTTGLVEHRLQGAPLVLLDSAGLVLGGEAAENVADLVAAEVQRRATLDVADALHVIWYCVDASSDRFEPAEAELVRRCATHVPTIVVLTKVADTEDQAVTALAEHITSLSLPIETVVAALAKERRLGTRRVSPHGLELLIATTISVLPEAARRAFVVAQRYAIDQQVIEARSIVMRRSLAAAELGLSGGVDAERLARHQLRMLADLSIVFSLTVPVATMRALVAAVSRGAKGIADVARRIIELLDARGVPGIEIAGQLLSAGTAVAATRACGEAYVRLCRELALRSIEGQPMPDDILARFLEQLA